MLAQCSDLSRSDEAVDARRALRVHNRPGDLQRKKCSNSFMFNRNIALYHISLRPKFRSIKLDAVKKVVDDTIEMKLYEIGFVTTGTEI